MTHDWAELERLSLRFLPGLVVHLRVLVSALNNLFNALITVSHVFLRDVLGELSCFAVFTEDNLQNGDQLSVAFMMLVNFNLVLVSHHFICYSHLLLGEVAQDVRELGIHVGSQSLVSLTSFERPFIIKSNLCLKVGNFIDISPRFTAQVNEDGLGMGQASIALYDKSLTREVRSLLLLLDLLSLEQEVRKDPR